MKKGTTITVEVERQIYLVRGHKVMFDSDLAALYGVSTKRLNEQVKRNIERFPDDFMFQLNVKEMNIWRSQIATSNPNAKGLFGRLASHASGRRSGDQFCIYICDRFVIPRLSPDELAALERGERILDRLTQGYIRSNLRYRSVVTTTGGEARILETHVRLHGLPSFGRPIVNP